MIRKLLFFVKEAFLGIRQSQLMMSLSLATVVVSLICFGFFLIVSVYLFQFSNHLHERLEITAFLSNSATKKEIHALVTACKTNHSEINHIEVIDRKRAWDSFKKMYSQLALDELLAENPLPPRLTMTLFPNAQIDQLASELKLAYELIDDVTYGGKSAETMQRVAHIILLFGIIVVGLLSVATLLIVLNTIQLTIMNRSEEIVIMKLVGATHGFIMAPFLLEGFILGVVASVIAVGCIHLGLQVAMAKLYTLIPLFPYQPSHSGLVYSLVFLWGCILTFLGAFLSTHATLKKSR